MMNDTLKYLPKKNQSLSLMYYIRHTPTQFEYHRPTQDVSRNDQGHMCKIIYRYVRTFIVEQVIIIIQLHLSNQPFYTFSTDSLQGCWWKQFSLAIRERYTSLMHFIRSASLIIFVAIRC